MNPYKDEPSDKSGGVTKNLGDSLRVRAKSWQKRRSIHHGDTKSLPPAQEDGALNVIQCRLQLMATVLSVKKRPRLQFQVARTLTKFGMVREGEHVLVAVSGGADSTALLLCLHELAPVLGIRLSAAHLNHCLRGEESEADAVFV